MAIKPISAKDLKAENFKTETTTKSPTDSYEQNLKRIAKEKAEQQRELESRKKWEKEQVERDRIKK